MGSKKPHPRGKDVKPRPVVREHASTASDGAGEGKSDRRPHPLKRRKGLLGLAIGLLVAWFAAMIYLAFFLPSR